MIPLYLAAGTLVSITQSTQTLVLKIIGLAFILILAVRVFRHFAGGDHGGLMGTAVFAFLAGFFIFDPAGVESLITSTVKAVGG